MPAQPSQHKDAASTTPVSSLPVTFTGATTTGNLLVVTVASFANPAPAVTLSVADNKGNTYTHVTGAPATSPFNNALVLDLWYCPNAIGGATHTITVTGTGTSYLNVSIDECTGADPATPLEAFVKAQSGSGTVVNPGALTTSEGAMALGAVATFIRPGYTPAAGFTEVCDSEAASTQALGVELRGGVPAGTIQPTWTLGSSGTWVALAASFKAPTAPTAVKPIQHRDVASSSPVTAQGVTFTSATTTGNLLVVTVASFANPAPAVTLSVADNKGNTYTHVTGAPATSPFNNAWILDLWYCPNAIGGATHTITVTGSGPSYLTVSLDECTGADPTTPLEAFIKAQSASGTAVDPGAVTASAGAMVLGAVSTTIRPGYTPAAGFTEVCDSEAASTQALGVELQGGVSAGAIHPTWTLGSSGTWIALAASFKLPPSTPPSARVRQDQSLAGQFQTLD
jgi:hypothetical protein